MNTTTPLKSAHPVLRRCNQAFEKFSHTITLWSGSSWAFCLALLVVVVWGVTGPLFDYSDTWQLVINTGTTIVTFLMVFLIQHAQNKDSQAIQLKLNELLASQQGASNQLINLEDWDEDQIVELHQRFAELTRHLQHARRNGDKHSIDEAGAAGGKSESSPRQEGTSEEEKLPATR